jgi:formate hydrogenlyase subunit 3/multisubunit Na+/H+ antiporter MnhD subunit
MKYFMLLMFMLLLTKFSKYLTISKLVIPFGYLKELSALNTTVLCVVFIVATCCLLHCSRVHSGAMEGTVYTKADTLRN